MRKETYEILMRCYNGAREGFALIKDGIVYYTNKALVAMAGCDISGKRTEELFDPQTSENYKVVLEQRKSIYVENVSLFGRILDIHAFKGKHMIAVVFTDLEAMEQELRKNEESFKLLKSAHKRLSDSITIVDSAAELMVKSIAAELPDPARQWLKKINEAVTNMNTALLDIVEIMDTREENANKGCAIGDMTACVNQVAEIIARQLTVRDASIEIKSTPENLIFTFNRKSLRHIILRLLADETELAQPGDVIELSLQQSDGFAEIILKSPNGAPEEEYIRFLENPNLKDMDGILKKYGKNLYLVRRLAMYYDGSMQVKRDGCGKIVTVCLPRVMVAPSVHQKIEELKREKTTPWWEMI